MFINKLKPVPACLVFLGLLLGAVNSASARSASLELPESLAQVSGNTAQTGDLVTFSQIITSDIMLNGPFDGTSIYFSLPANWRLTPGAQLNLSMTSTFNQNTQIASGTFNGSAGSITVLLNNVVIGVASIQSAEEATFQFQIPPETFNVTRTDGLYQLRFVLESGWACDFDENMLVAIHTSSSMILPHESVLTDTNLVKFPSPIYQGNSILTIPMLAVIPDQPTAAELQSAMTIAAGFGNLSSRTLVTDLNTVGHLTSEQLQNNNLVLIGKAATLPLSNQLNLPLPATNSVFSNVGGNPDDGVVQLINSPWSEDKVVLIVSGNTDAAVIKAAQAVSTGILRSGPFPNVSIVDVVNTTPISTSPYVDQTLTDMGYGGTEFTNVGLNYTGYKFYIPPGQTITKNAYFELQYGHSALLQYDRAGIVVSVNGKPIGSISLTEESAHQAVNLARFSIPPSAVLTGNNSLELNVSLIPVDRCINPNLNGIYANIWPESSLHLPLENAVTNPTANYDLISYPAPFTYDSTLGSTGFVLQRDDLNSWRDVFSVASYLGDSSNGPVTTLSTFFADELPEAERSKYNFIMVGRPSQLPVVGEINNFLPAPFDLGQDVAIEPEMQVKYRVNPKAAAGYIEMLTSPWNGDNIILLAVGNDSQGVAWAASHLIAPLSWVLAGNFAVIIDQQVYTANTRMTTITPGIASTQEAILEVVPPSIQMGVPSPYLPTWIFPALIVSVVLIVLTIITAISISWSRNRAGRKPAVSKIKPK
ncbi:MAG: cellulose biosynthesis cyclic di-GMP-binding regulatory protein BcsB [Anaerolineales bacterium]